MSGKYFPGTTRQTMERLVFRVERNCFYGIIRIGVFVRHRDGGRQGHMERRRGRVFLILLALSFLFVTMAQADEKVIIGSVEEVILLPSGVRLPARVDTGAAVTSLDARELKVENGMASFRLPDKYGGLAMKLAVRRWKVVRSAGARQKRPVVEIEICMGRKLLRIEANLNDRSKVEYPMIIGRNVLAEGFVVDCSKEKTLKPDCPGLAPR